LPPAGSPARSQAMSRNRPMPIKVAVAIQWKRHQKALRQLVGSAVPKFVAGRSRADPAATLPIDEALREARQRFRRFGYPKNGPDPRSPDFLRTPQWRRIRYDALRLHGGRCQCCGADAAAGAVINVDHIFPRKTHPHLALELTNLQVLCGVCNAGKGNRDATNWRVA
jgi:5-methylcytosine-specific restriction endonuclease McrA